jgi:hypothetical protein
VSGVDAREARAAERAPRRSPYLGGVSANQNQVIAGALFLLVGAFASAGIAISLYPILRRHNPGLALGAVGFRTMEAVLYAGGVVGVLLLVTLSQDFVQAGAPASPYFQTLGSQLLAVRDRTNLVGILAFHLGAFLYWCFFLRSGIIPRWLSGWGLVGVILGAVAGLFVMFRVIITLSTVQVLLNIPIGVNEIVLAVWLIVRGFDASADAPRSAQQIGRLDRGESH